MRPLKHLYFAPLLLVGFACNGMKEETRVGETVASALSYDPTTRFTGVCSSDPDTYTPVVFDTEVAIPKSWGVGASRPEARESALKRGLQVLVAARYDCTGDCPPKTKDCTKLQFAELHGADVTVDYGCNSSKWPDGTVTYSCQVEGKTDPADPTIVRAFCHCFDCDFVNPSPPVKPPAKTESEPSPGSSGAGGAAPE